MAKLEQFHNNMAQKFEKTNIRTQLITNAELSQSYQKSFHYNNNLKNPSLPPIVKPIFRQGSKDSDQLSSGYRSNRSGSLPSNSSNELVNENDHYELDYCKPALVDPKTICLKGKPPRFHNLAQEKTNNHQKLSLSSSINDYSNIEHEMLNKPFGTPSSSTSSIASHDIYSLSSSYAHSNIDCGYQKSSKERAKWGSYMYDPFLAKDTNGRSSNNGPVWLEKSLSEARDSEEDTMSVSVKSDVISISSFLRGQNVPVDPNVLLERENKRRKAMELQDAIKDQLRERELQKKIEKENKIREEKIEEARLNKQMQLEHERLQKEQNTQQEKLNNERKKQEVMKQALERATLEAQAEREKRKREKTLASQASLDETISIERTGERTEIFMDGCEKSQEIRDEWKEQSQSPGNLSLQPNIGEDEDGETVLIGTPIKLKKKNLEIYRRKVYKRQTNFEENYRHISEDNTYNSQTSTPKSTSISMDTSSELSSIKAPHKRMSEIDGVGLLLQTLQPLVPFQMTNDLFGLNQLNLGNLQLALLVQQQQQLQLQMQSRMSTPSVYLPPMSASPPCVSNRIKSPQRDIERKDIECKETPSQEQHKECQVSDAESIKNEETSSTVTMASPRESIKSLPPERQIPTTIITSPIKSILKKESSFGNPYIPDKHPFILLPQDSSLPHDGTFTKDEHFHKLDAFTSTEDSLSPRLLGPKRDSEIRILTPYKYRTNESKIKVKLEDTGTQTENSCEFCCCHSHCSVNSPGSQNSNRSCCNSKNNHQTNCGSNNQEGSNTNSLSRSKSKEKSSLDNRPKWGVNKPPREFVKASERDPVYARNRRKRYAKKVVDSSDESCNIRDCPVVSLNNKKFTTRNICSEILPIKTDHHGRVYLVTSEEDFLSYRRQQSQLQKQFTIKNNLKNIDKNSFLNENYDAKFYVSKRDDFQNLFSD